MPGLSYSQYITQIAQMAVVQETDPNFVSITPSMISYAELRIYRDLDFMEVSTALHGDSYKVVAGNRNFSFNKNLPDGSSFVVSEQINIITPIGQNDPDQGVRTPLLPTTKEFLDAVYGSSLSANRAQPVYYAPFNDSTFIVGPVPESEYYLEIVGTVRPAPISETNTVTFISQYFPDLFIMASMIYVSAYQRNFGKQSDDPQMAQSYESQYQTILKSSATEEARKKYEASAWSSQAAAVSATPTR